MSIRAKKIQSVKIEAIASVKSMLAEYTDFIFVDYRGLTVAQITELRKQLSGKNCVFKVIKNNFARIAFQKLNISTVSDFLRGPTAVALSKEETNETAKILYDFAKEAPALGIKGGYVANEVYDSAKLDTFSKLPSKKRLVAMIMSTINAPIQKIAAILQLYVDKKTAEGGSAIVV
jgi:large subunit ribosomal protein L10